MNLKLARPRGRPRNRWQNEVMEDGRMVGGEEWQEEVCNREECKESSHCAHANGMNE
jgi:hypothetical protein